MSERDPLCHVCGEACDCGERPHEERCGYCSICLELDDYEPCLGCQICDPVSADDEGSR
jgi:hypothetical protein